MLSFAWWLSLLVGFLSLSEEILWVRVVGFGYKTLPPAFSFVLAAYLVGIALGAALGKRLCEGSRNLYVVAAVVLGCAALLDAAIPLLVPAFIVPFEPVSTRVLALLVILTAGIKSILFPIAHHLGALASGPGVGRSVSRVYFGNIIGSTLGPLLTGFVALEYLRVDQCFALVAAACLILALACAAKARARLVLAGCAVPIALCAWTTLPLPSAAGGMLSPLADQRNGHTISHFVSNRHGVIHTLGDGAGDIVFGGNVYDGIASVNVDINPNRLDRLYILALVHERPRNVLVVGLSTGAWTRAIQGFPGVERIDIVEINPAYLDLIQRYPDVAPLLDDPRVHVHVDDGRRWLKRNPETRFDLVVQNTTYHWRANATNLLSREYFEEVQSHLSPKGILTVNTTGSFDVLETLSAVYRYTYRYGNFGYASDHPLAVEHERLASVKRPDGTLFSLAQPTEESVAARLAVARFEPARLFIAGHGVHAELITDDNLLTEYGHGQRFGASALRGLLPPEPERFALDSPVVVTQSQR